MRHGTVAKLAAKRRFTILVLLHTSPHTYDELIAVLQAQDLLELDRDDNDTALANQQRYQFRRDLVAIRHMGCKIAYDQHSKKYSWRNSPFGLSLTQEQLTTFALILDTFADTQVLHAMDIQQLLRYFIALLPQEQQKALESHHRSFTIDLHEATDYRDMDPKTLSEIEKAIKLETQLDFQYRNSKGQIVKHRIEPDPMVFERGHVYLKGWSLDYDKELKFRLDYILPGTAEEIRIKRRSRPKARTYTLRYSLAPELAHGKVSEHFPEQVVEMQEDGSAMVTAQITDLFEARRILLSYGLNCTVLEPPALVDEMRTIAEGLYKMYHKSEP